MSASATKRSRVPLPIRSDSLRPLRTLLARNPGLVQLSGAFQVRLIVDANAVLADVRWLAIKREDPAARTTLQEVIAAGTAVVYAPEFIDEEVRKNVPRIAMDEGVSEDRLIAAWEEYRIGLRIVAPSTKRDSPDPVEVADPKDLPYVDLCFELGAAAVYSADKHLTAMGVPVVKKAYLSDLRTYSRAAAISMTLTVGGTAAVVVSASSAFSLVRWLVVLLKRLPPIPKEMKIALLLVGGILVVHPGARAWALRKLEAVSPHLVRLYGTLAPMIGRLAAEALDAHDDARVALASAKRRLPSSPRYQLRTHVLAVLVAADSPLSAAEIIRRLRAAGCRAKSNKLASYIGKSLSADPRFMRNAAGCWTVSAIQR